MTLRIPVVCTAEQDLFDVGHTIVLTIVEQAMAQGMPAEPLALLMRGLFSGSMATLQTLQGDREVHDMFHALLAGSAADKGH